MTPTQTCFRAAIPVAATLFATVASAALPAQQPAKSSATLHKATTPTYAGTYHPASGFHSASGGTARSGPEVLYNNTTLTNYYFAPGAGQEWIDEGTVPVRNASGMDQINAFEFTYCSSNTNQNGVDVVLHFYQDTTYCVGPTSWPTSDCSYSIAGMPGANQNGAIACYTINVSLAGGYECEFDAQSATGLFGWSSIYSDGRSGPFAATGGSGNADAFTWFDPAKPKADAFQGCFWFGGQPFAGFALKLQANPPEVFSLPYGRTQPGRDMALRVSNQAIVGGSASVAAYDLADTIVPNTRLVVSTGLDVAGARVPGIGRIYLVGGPAKMYDSTSPTGIHDISPISGPMTFYLQVAVESSPNQPTRLSNVLQVNVL